VQDHYIYDYAVIRVVPKVEREEFINAGIILFCPEKEFLEARFDLDEQKLSALAPGSDLALIKTHLSVIPVICRGGYEAGDLSKLSQRERFHWLTSPRSTIIQTSPVHNGYCSNPEEELNHLVKVMVKMQSENE